MGAARRQVGVWGLAILVWLALGCSTGDGGVSGGPPPAPVTTAPWRFAVLGDTHVPSSTLLSELVPALVAERVKLVLVPGDLVEAGAAASASTLAAQLATWKSLVAPLRDAGIAVYPIRGNHEADARGSAETWKASFSGAWAVPGNGPAAEAGLSYSFTFENALFIGLDQYVNLHRVDQDWLETQLGANTRPHVFVFGHEPAFKVFHADGMDDDAPARDRFWRALKSAGSRFYFCGHDHFFDAARIDEGGVQPDQALLQVVAGTGGGTLFDSYRYNGDNGAYTPAGLHHAVSHGYTVVEVEGTGGADLGQTLVFKQRSPEGTYAAAFTYRTTAGPRSGATRTYPVVDTGQTACYSATAEIPAPAPGTPFFGQDAQHTGLQPRYQDHGDGTVSDLNTGLMWVKARGTKQTWAQASAGASACRVGGHSDWRMPTVKELYSLILFTGAQGPSLTSLEGYIPFLDTLAFDFTYGPTGSSSTGERVIDCQDWSSTLYAGTVMSGQTAAFGVNFGDGRIKGYPVTSSNHVRYVRGNADYGRNAFHDNGDGTVTDTATGLMWCQADGGGGMDWPTALAWVQAMNTQRHLGHSDWRMPNAKELHTLVDYSRAPLAADPSRRGPALDPVFQCTPMVDEGGGTEVPFYWTSTSFRDGSRDAIPAAYVTFGRALGWMKLGSSATYQLLDVHGAGAQRSDPKTGRVTDYLLGQDASGRPVYGRGPQGDVVRIQNGVRLVRDAK